MKNKYIKLIIILFLLIAFDPVFGKNIEVVTTIPVETSLEKFDTRKAVDVWPEMIKNAEHSIDIAQFYLAKDPKNKEEPNKKEKELIEKVIENLLKAAKRGVKIRILVGKAVNKDMKKNTDEVLGTLKNIPNIEITLFDWKELNGSIIHAKYFIIDKKKIFVGSQNFDWRALKHIHETGLLIEDKRAAAALLSIFDIDWKYSNGDKEIYNKIKKSPPLSMNDNIYLVASPEKYNPPGIKSALAILLKLIGDAKNKIHIQLLNYKEKIYRKKEGFLTLTNALKNAAGRGVKVKMIVSNWFSKGKGKLTLLNLNKVKGLEVKMVKIPESKEGFIPYSRVIHSKVMRIDKKICWVGTSNWGHGYFYASRNVEMVVKDSKTAETLDKLFKQLWNYKHIDIVDGINDYPPAKRN